MIANLLVPFVLHVFRSPLVDPELQATISVILVQAGVVTGDCTVIKFPRSVLRLPVHHTLNISIMFLMHKQFPAVSVPAV